jgi:hypothetical protein
MGAAKSGQKKTPVGEEVDGRFFERRSAREEVRVTPYRGDEGGGSSRRIPLS